MLFNDPTAEVRLPIHNHSIVFFLPFLRPWVLPDTSRDTVMEYLINVTTAQEFRPWEVSALTPNVRRDVDDAADSSHVGQYPST